MDGSQLWRQGLTFISVCKDQISMELLHLLYDSMKEIDSVILIKSEALEEIPLTNSTVIFAETEHITIHHLLLR